MKWLAYIVVDDSGNPIEPGVAKIDASNTLQGAVQQLPPTIVDSACVIDVYDTSDAAKDAAATFWFNHVENRRWK